MSKGIIGKSEVWNVADIAKGADEAIAQVKRVADESVRLIQKAGKDANFGGVFGTSGDTNKIITQLNTALKSLQTITDNLTKSITKNTTAKTKNKAASSEQEKRTKELIALGKQATEINKNATKAKEREISATKRANELNAQTLKGRMGLNAERRKGLGLLAKQAAAINTSGEKAHAAAIKKSAAASKKANTEARKLIGTYAGLKVSLQGNIVKYQNLVLKKKENTIAGKKLQAQIRAEQAELNRVNKTMGTGVKKTSRLTSSFRNMTMSLKNLAVAYFGFQTLMRGFQDIFKVTKILDSVTFAQEKVIKSSTEMAQTQVWLSKIIGDYGLDLVTVTNRYTKFRAATISSNLSAIQTQKIFGSMSKAAATLGLKTDELQGVYLALEQMISKNKVTTEELRRQLGERLPGAFDIMAKSMKVSTNELNKMLRAGVVMSEEVLPGFAIAVEEAYGIKSVEFVDTLIAAQNRLRTAWIEFIKLLDGADFFKGFLNSMASAVKWIGDNITLITKLAAAIVNLTGAYLAYIAVKKLLLASNIKEITVTNLLIAAKLRFAASLKAVTTALRVMFTTTGGIIGVIVTLTSILLPFLLIKKKATEQIKDFNTEVDEEHKKLTILFSSLRNAAKGTKEWMFARAEVNKEYGAYLQNIIDEKTTVKDLNDELERLLIITRSNTAERHKAKEVSEANAKALAVENKTLDILFENQKQLISSGELTAESATTQRLRHLDLAKSIADGTNTMNAQELGMGELVNAYRELSASLKEIGDRYDTLIEKPSIEGIFRPDVFATGLAKAKKTFSGMQGLAGDTADKFSEMNGILLEGFKDISFAKNFKNYESFLNQLLIKYKDNVDARILIEQELFSIKSKTGGGKNNELKLQEQRDKASLKLQEEGLETSLANKIANGATEEEIDNQIFFNKQSLLNLEIKLNNERKDKFVKTEKEILDIETQNAGLREQLAENVTDFQIDEARRAENEKRRLAKEGIDDERLASAFGIENITMAAANEIDAIRKLNDERVISKKEMARRILEIEQKLNDDILNEQIKNKNLLLNSDVLSADQTKRLLEEVAKLRIQLSENRINNAKNTTEELSFIESEEFAKSVEIVNALFDARMQSLDNQLVRAKEARDFSVALAGSNIEEKIKAERKYEKEEAKIRQKQARTAKAQAAFNIITNTARGIMQTIGDLGFFGSPLAILVAALGAVQLATVLAQPIPKFSEGVEGFGGGLAIVGDKKGDSSLTQRGGSELITTPSGSFLSPMFPTLMDLPAGTDVIPSGETQMILANGAKQSAYERIDMSRSEGYLKEIAKKDSVKREGGYKYVTRKGFEGKYRCS